jgi:tRNA nucleotidyltransferase (CCA-adding enzyme)
MSFMNPVVVVTAFLPTYVDDFALIARRFMYMENLDTLFALISMADRIYLIARSRIAEVNVGIIARDLGGGGHATAASATLKDMTLTEAQEKLIHTLHRHVLPQPIAREMMSKPAITIPADTTIGEAKDISPATMSPPCPSFSAGHSDGRSCAAMIDRRHHLADGGEEAIHHDWVSAGQRLYDST